MPSLAEAQANFIATINDGPDRLDPALFSGDFRRVILGLKAHANTINHARLVALEETFPRSMEALGKAEFNRLSRIFVDGRDARSSSANVIGKNFPPFLAKCSVDAEIIDLARIEWLWLECYHARDAISLQMEDFSGLAEEDLLTKRVVLHPAARLFYPAVRLSDQLPELAGTPCPHALLLTRPDSAPIFTPLDAPSSALCEAAKNICSIGNLLEKSLELTGDKEPLAPIITLVNAGALTFSEGPRNDDHADIL